MCWWVEVRYSLWLGYQHVTIMTDPIAPSGVQQGPRGEITVGVPRGGITVRVQQESCPNHYSEQLSCWTPTLIPPLRPSGTQLCKKILRFDPSLGSNNPCLKNYSIKNHHIFRNGRTSAFIWHPWIPLKIFCNIEKSVCICIIMRNGPKLCKCKRFFLCCKIF